MDKTWKIQERTADNLDCAVLFPIEATSDFFGTTVGIASPKRAEDRISAKMISATFLAINCTLLNAEDDRQASFSRQVGLD